MTEIISSIKDPRVILARELQSGDGRKKHNKFLLYGLEQIKWAIDRNINIYYIFCEKELHDYKLLFLEVSSGILKKISDTNYLVPYIAVAEIPSSKKSGISEDFILVLDQIQDYGNLGTIIRTAQGFSVNTFVFSNINADPFQRKVIDSSRGLVFSGNFKYEINPQTTISYLKPLGYQLVVTSPHAKSLQSQAPLLPGKPIALIIGNETKGVDQLFIDSEDIAIQIPMNKSVESLNVAISAGISIYELRFKQVLLMLKEKIFTNFGREINILGKYIRMAFDKEISRVTNLSGMQVILLMVMHCDQIMSKEQIGKDIGLFGQELDQFLELLLEKKLIIVKNNNYNLTPEGERFLAEIWPIVEQTQQKLFSDLKDHEIQDLMRLVEKVKESCIKIMNAI